MHDSRYAKARKAAPTERNHVFFAQGAVALRLDDRGDYFAESVVRYTDNGNLAD